MPSRFGQEPVADERQELHAALRAAFFPGLDAGRRAAFSPGLDAGRRDWQRELQAYLWEAQAGARNAVRPPVSRCREAVLLQHRPPSLVFLAVQHPELGGIPPTLAL